MCAWKHSSNREQIVYKFTISPRNTEKIIVKLSAKFDVFDVIKTDKNVTFSCYNKDKKNIIKTLKFFGYRDFICQPVRGTSVLNSFTSAGIVCGIVFCTILWLISSFFITDVIILGDIDFTEQKIYEVLNQNNIHSFTPKSNIDVENIENQILNIPYISYVSIIIRGNALIINIREQLTNTEIVDSGNFAPLVSIYDCKITSIKLIQGTLAVQVGDIVRVGDVLVYPYTTDSQGNTRSVQPLANIVADVYITSALTVYDQKIERKYSGNVVKNYEISFLGLQLFSTQYEVSFPKYESETYTRYIFDTLLPIKITYKNYYEYTDVVVYSNFSENLEEYVDKTRQTALLNIKDYDIIKNESHIIRDYDGYHVVEYSLTVNKKIA